MDAQQVIGLCLLVGIPFVAIALGFTARYLWPVVEQRLDLWHRIEDHKNRMKLIELERIEREARK